MKVTVISIVVSNLGTIPKEMEQELENLDIREQVGTIPTTALLTATRIPSPEDLGELAVSQNPCRNHKL